MLPPDLEWLTTADIAEEKAVCQATVLYWMRQGIQVNGKNIKLMSERHGKRFKARRCWLAEFLETLARASVATKPLVRTVAARISGQGGVATALPAPAVSVSPAG